MADPRFFEKAEERTLQELAEQTGATLLRSDSGSQKVADVAPLDRAGADDISFLDNTKYLATFSGSQAGACVLREKYADKAPEGMALLISDDPYRCYAKIAQIFYPFMPVVNEVSPAAFVDGTAKIAKGCSIAPGAFIGKNVEIGAGCDVGANAVIHDGVKIGENTRIGALTSLSHCLIGSGVIIHRGVHIGQDGFGFALGADGHVKVPQLGRVIIEDAVEIGAATCIDRGTGPDTIIGAGTKIDNLVQIGHNVQIGRGAVIISQTGISGSTRLGDGVVMAGQSGVAGHLKIGAGVRVAARAGVINDIPPGTSVGGTPAIPVKEWHRQTIALKQLAKKTRK